MEQSHLGVNRPARAAMQGPTHNRLLLHAISAILTPQPQ